jgi:predicted nuclease with TOPRIM domain
MWLPKTLYELFKTSKEQVDALFVEVYSLRNENVNLKTQLASTQANFDWLKIRVNQLEVERAQLIEKAYGVKTLVPEIARRPEVPVGFQSDLFEDMGEKAAKALGLPYFESQFENSPS